MPVTARPPRNLCQPALETNGRAEKADKDLQKERGEEVKSGMLDWTDTDTERKGKQRRTKPTLRR